ncbi:MAG: FliM/FliN family flagellar motor switch protein [Hyphomicrobiales bacterium]
MNGLEEVLGVAASLERVGRPPRAAEAAFHFEAVTPAGRYPLAVEIDDPAVMARIADALAPFAAPDGGDAHAPRQLEIVIGPVSLAPEDAEALAPGDQIVLDEARGDQVQGTLNVAGRPLFAITIKGPQATLVSAIEAPSSPTGGLVAIGFVFGRREVSARDLRDLAPGSTLDFAKLGSNVVEIVDGATVIGRGELMRVDGAIGVRITGMNS